MGNEVIAVVLFLLGSSCNAFIIPKQSFVLRCPSSVRPFKTMMMLNNIRGRNGDYGSGWRDLLPIEGRPYLDISLRKELLKYGELTQMTYDGFESRPEKSRFGQARWSPPEFLQGLNDAACEEARRYHFAFNGEDPKGCNNYIYANSSQFDLWVYRSNDTDLNERDLDRYNAGHKARAAPEYAWVGYIAVNGTKDDENVDVVVAFRGTILPGEWTMNVLGNFLSDLVVSKDNLPSPHSQQASSNNMSATHAELTDEAEAPATTRSPGRFQNVIDDKLDAYRNWKQALDGVKVHKGFLAIFNTSIEVNGKMTSPRGVVTNRTRALVEQELAGKVKSITFVGHSLGGALATLAAGWMGWIRNEIIHSSGNQTLKDLWGNVSITAYTFAAPRVGDIKFREKLENVSVPVLNVVNVRDVVPNVPGVVTSLLSSAEAVVLGPRGELTPVRQTKGKGESLVWKWAKGVPGLGNVIKWAGSWSYVDSGVELRLNSDKNPCVRSFGLSDLGPKHNLEGLLYMLATQHIKDETDVVFRDVALMNKNEDMLNKSLAKGLEIPPGWWSPVNHSGLKPMVVKHDGVSVVIRRFDYNQY